MSQPGHRLRSLYTLFKERTFSVKKKKILCFGFVHFTSELVLLLIEIKYPTITTNLYETVLFDSIPDETFLIGVPHNRQ